MQRSPNFTVLKPTPLQIWGIGKFQAQRFHFCWSDEGAVTWVLIPFPGIAQLLDLRQHLKKIRKSGLGV
jgi:hypothetical protein